MRKIERDITNSLVAMASGVFSNTAITVVSDPRGTTPHRVEVVLHASLIATFDIRADKKISNLRINVSGWDSRITRSRLGLVIRHAADVNGLTADQYPKGLGVSSRAGVVRIHDTRGETVIADDGWYNVEVQA